MANSDPVEEIQNLKQRITELESKEAAYKHGKRLVQAFNQASRAMSVATTPEEIFDTVAKTLKELGISSVIFSTDQNQENVIVNSITFESQAINAAEKLAGIEAIGFAIPIDMVDVLRISIRERRTHFSRDSKGILHQLMPEHLKKFSGQVAKILNIPIIISTPLISGDDVVGLLYIHSDELVAEDIPLVTAFAHQVASSWRKSQLYQQAQQDISERKENERALQQRATQLAFLNDIGKQIVAVLDLERVFQRTVQLVQESFGYHHVSIFTLDPQLKTVFLRAKAGVFDDLFPPEYTLKIGQGMVGWAVENNQTLLSNDVTTEKRHTNLYPDVLPTRSELCVPIYIGEQVIGVLDAQSPEIDAFDDSDITVMQTLAGQIAIAIENARLHNAVRKELIERERTETELQFRANQLSALNQMGQVISSSLNIERVLEQVIHVVPPLVDADGVSILLRENSEELIFAAASGKGAKNLQGQKIPANAGIAGHVLKNGTPVLINSHKDQELLYRDIEDLSGYHTQSLLAVPLVLGQEIIGVLEAVHTQPNAFNDDDLQIIETAGSWVSIAIGNARQHAAIERRLKETQALTSINQALNETLDLDRLLQLMVDSINRIISHIERVVVHLYDEENSTLVPAAVAGVAPDRKPHLQMGIGQGIAGQVIKEGLPINVRDTQKDQRFIPIDGATYLRSLLVVPVQSGARRLGTISVSSTIPKVFTDEDEHLLTMIGVQAALAIESARLFKETQQRAQHLALLNEITQAALQQPDLQTILHTLVERIQKVYNSDGCYITFWDDEIKCPIPIAAAGSMRNNYKNLIVKTNEPTLTQAVLEAEHALTIDDTRHSKNISKRLAKQFSDRFVLALPLIAGEQRLGAVIISYLSHHNFTTKEISLGESIAQQTALAISKAKLLDAEQLRRREAETLRDITTALTATLEIDQVLERILLRLEEAIPYDSAAVMLVEGDTLTIVAGRGIEDFNITIGQQIPATAIVFQEISTSRQSIIIQDVLKDARWEYLDTGVPVRSWMGVPLIIQEEVIGYLTIDNWKPAMYTEQHLGLAQAVGNQASIALQNARLYAATRRRLAESNTLFYISNLIVDSAEPDVEAILHQVVDQLWQNFGYYHVHVYLIDQESGTLIANQGSGTIGAELKEQGYRFTSEEGIVGYAASVGEAFMTNNVADVLFFMPNPLLPRTSAEFAAPLRVRGQILGVLDVLHQPPNTFDADDFRFLTTVADQIAVVLDKALLYNQLQEALEKEQSTRSQLVQTEKLAAMGRLIASVAHELNNPLQAIQNALYLVKLEENLSPQAAEDLQVAFDEGTRMAGLIARLRDTYRPVVAADYQVESVDILAEEVRKLIGTHLHHSNVSLEFTPNPDLPKTLVIRDQIKQVILNLCINAIESMPQGGKLTIFSTYHPDAEEIHLDISDTGPGMTSEVQAKIFEPFFTTKEGGTGLGLAVSYEIAQNHGGSIEAKNNPGPGATFTLTLPCKPLVLE